MRNYWLLNGKQYVQKYLTLSTSNWLYVSTPSSSFKLSPIV